MIPMCNPVVVEIICVALVVSHSSESMATVMFNNEAKRKETRLCAGQEDYCFCINTKKSTA